MDKKFKRAGESGFCVCRFLTNKYVATVVSPAGGYMLSLGGYHNIWPLFGASNQLLAAVLAEEPAAQPHGAK